MTGIEAIKAFFGTPDKPLKAKELSAFTKDKDAFVELKELCLAHFESEGAVVGEIAEKAV